MKTEQQQLIELIRRKQDLEVESIRASVTFDFPTMRRLSKHRKRIDDSIQRLSNAVFEPVV